MKCDYCGEIVPKKPSRIKIHKFHFCNRECSTKFHSKKIKVKCAYCGKIKKVHQRTIKKNKTGLYFCNNKCHSKHKNKKIIAICNYCGKPVPKSPSYFNRSDIHFCNPQCLGKYMRGDNFDKHYPSEFNDTLKKKVKKRDKWACQLCGFEDYLHNGRLIVHHTDDDRRNNDLLNLVSLCRSCHEKTKQDRLYWQSYFQNLMRRKYVENREMGHRTSDPHIC